MAAIIHKLVRILAFGAMAVAVLPAAVLGPVLFPANAAEDDDEGGPDEDGGAAKDEGKGKDESTSSWELTIKLNRALLVWDDGQGTQVYSVNNSYDVAVEGSQQLDQNWTAGTTLSLETNFPKAESVDQLHREGDGFVAEVEEATVNIARSKWGTITVGHADSSSSDVDNINLAGPDELANAAVEDWIQDFYLRATGFAGDAGLADGRRHAFNAGSDALRWGDYIPGTLADETGRYITYVAPKLMGFEAAASVGQPEEILLAKTELAPDEFLFTDRTGGLYADVALRYSADWEKTFRIKSGIAVWRDTTEEAGAEEPTEDTGIGGSIAVMHIPSGLNIAASYSFEGHTDRCAEPGEVSGKCRGPDRYLYVKGGIVRDWTEGSRTALYGEYYKGWREENQSNESLALAFNDETAEELKHSVVTVWGVGVTQQISSAELYAGYRHYDLDVDLIGPGDRPVRGRHVEDMHVVKAGLKIRLHLP